MLTKWVALQERNPEFGEPTSFIMGSRRIPAFAQQDNTIIIFKVLSKLGLCSGGRHSLCFLRIVYHTNVLDEIVQRMLRLSAYNIYRNLRTTWKTVFQHVSDISLDLQSPVFKSLYLCLIHSLLLSPQWYVQKLLTMISSFYFFEILCQCDFDNNVVYWEFRLIWVYNLRYYLEYWFTNTRN